MPKTKITIYQEQAEVVPLLDWLDEQSEKVQDKCIAKIRRLEKMGLELRRPECDYLSEGIYELRVKGNKVNYRILYAFSGKNAVLLSHGCTKGRKVPRKEIKRAMKNLAEYKRNPRKHTFNGEL